MPKPSKKVKRRVGGKRPKDKNAYRDLALAIMRRAESPAHEKKRAEFNQYRVLLREALVAPDNMTTSKPVILSAGAIVELMDMRVMFRDRVSPITRRADEILVRYGQRGKETLGWLAKGTPMKVVRGPLFFAKTSDAVALGPWDRVRYFVARADSKQMHHQRWWLGPWLQANAATADEEIKKAIRELGGRPDKKAADPDVHAAHLFHLITSQELDMATKKQSTKKAKGSKKAERVSNKKDKNEKAEKGAKAPKAVKAGKPAKAIKLAPVITTKNHSAYERQREYDTYTIKRLTKENPHRDGSTQGKRWAILRKGISVGEYVSKGGSRGTLSQWLRTGAAKLVRAGGDAGAE